MPDVGAVREIGLEFCLENSVLPLIKRGAIRAVMIGDTALRDDAVMSRIRERLGVVAPIATPAPTVRARLLSLFRARMIDTAETCVAARESCRSNPFAEAAPILAILLLTLMFVAIVHPGVPVAALLWLSLMTISANALLGAVAIILSFGAPPQEPVMAGPDADGSAQAQWPVISVLVPVFHETVMLSRLVERLGRLDYPADRLDVLLICEEDDAAMREALQAMARPSTMRIITVPRGAVQTKPRAMNFALHFARGEIVGIYDAEDAPGPDQLRQVALRFATEGPRTACLQGALAFYNSTDSWITRAFALDYAMWFRTILPALSRLDAVVPLGGTTVFLRRAALDEIGGWDAHNVTEDADLGVRLRRRGYRCRLFDGTTMEEAPDRAWPWIRQRSRWLKGYALTWAVHMRQPGRLLRDIGPGGFLWFQLLFLGALAGFGLAPFLWMFWLQSAFTGTDFLPSWAPAGAAMTTPLVLSASVQVVAALRATRLGGLGWAHAFWIPALWPYFAMGTAALYKAVAECAVNPFYWDKTAHGTSPGSIRP